MAGSRRSGFGCSNSEKLRNSIPRTSEPGRFLLRLCHWQFCLRLDSHLVHLRLFRLNRDRLRGLRRRISFFADWIQRRGTEQTCNSVPMVRHRRRLFAGHRPFKMKDVEKSRLLPNSLSKLRQIITDLGQIREGRSSRDSRTKISGRFQPLRSVLSLAFDCCLFPQENHLGQFYSCRNA